ncbi:MAG: hypothetical protein WC047_02875 [Kiritimatiellales bacterium]
MTAEHKYDYIVTPYPEKLATLLRVPYPILWILISGLLLSIQSGAFFFAHGKPFCCWPYIVFCLLPAILAITIVRFSKILEDFTPSLMSFLSWPEAQTLDWYSEKIRLIFNPRRMSIVGVCFILAMLHWTRTLPLYPKETLPKLTFLAILLIVQFIGGSMLYVMWHIALMVRALGKIDAIKISIYQHPLSSVKAVGALMARFAFTIVLIYIFGASYSLVCMSTASVLVTDLIFGAIVLVFFFFPQMEIHKLMFKVKHQRLIRFSAHLETALQQVAENPSRETVQQVRELFDIQRSLNEMGEWPFNTKMFMAILTGIAVPLIAVLLQASCQWVEKVFIK